MADSETRLAVIIPKRNVASESFIGTHIEGLFSDPVVIWGSPRPLFLIDETSVLAGPWRAAAGALARIWRVGAERTHGAIGRRLRERTYTRVLARFLRHSGTEVVLAEYGPTAVTVREACAVSRTPLVVHFHGFDAYRHETVAEMREPYQRLFQTASRIVAVSKDMVDQLAKLGCPTEKIVCNPCGVDIDRFRGARPGESDPVFVALGRFVDKKGPMLTLRAFAQVRSEERRARLVMLGDGPLREACIALARRLGVGDVVEFPGVVKHDEVADWMLAARCFVQHSQRADDGDSEGTPVAVLEASSCGLPVVSTKHAGIVEAVVDGSCGFLVDEGDVDGMARQMVRLVRDPKLAASMGAAGRRHVEANYSLEKSLDRLRSVLSEAAHSG